MFLTENRLIFFWKHIRRVCCFSMTALFADNVNFPLFFVCRTILCGEFIACFTYFNCNVDITGLGRNGSFFKIFCDHTAASWIVITNPFNSKFSRLFADFCFYNVSWFFKICSLFLFCFYDFIHNLCPYFFMSVIRSKICILVIAHPDRSCMIRSITAEPVIVTV